MTGRELRMQLRLQQACNKPADLCNNNEAESCTPEGVAQLHSLGDATCNNPATYEQAAELRALVATVAADWSEVERAEGLAVALADPNDALTCWRALAMGHAAKAAPTAYPAGLYTLTPLPERDPDDDRRTCTDCANLSAIGRCRTPPFAAKRDYCPISDALQRCARFTPRPDEADRRIGAERWPSLLVKGATDKANHAR